jgi:hypothetical protein
MSYDSGDVELTPAEVDAVLSKLCTKLGFCLPVKECERFRTSPPSDVREFTNQVFRSEGLEPKRADTELWRQVRDIIAEAFETHAGPQDLTKRCSQPPTRDGLAFHD